MKNSTLYYSVGALLYCPANNERIAASIIAERFGKLFSLALCLEDTIRDECVAEAEQSLISSLQKIYTEHRTKNFYLPKIFVRIRHPEQISSLLERLKEAATLLYGFILPKFSLENADDYIAAMQTANQKYGHQLYMMPIFERKTGCCGRIGLKYSGGRQRSVPYVWIPPPQHRIHSQPASDRQYPFRYHDSIWHGLCSFWASVGILQWR